MKEMKFERLRISLLVLMKYMKKVENPGENYFTMISKADYHRIKREVWSGTNKYVATCRNGKAVYLHRELCPGLKKGQYTHHRGSKFDNRSGMVETVMPKDHDQHRTYCGDLVIDVK